MYSHVILLHTQYINNVIVYSHVLLLLIVIFYVVYSRVILQPIKYINNVIM